MGVGRRIPEAGSGSVAADPSLLWETRLVKNEVINNLGARVVHLEIRDTKFVKAQPEAQAEPLVVVEVVLPGLPHQGRQVPEQGGRP